MKASDFVIGESVVVGKFENQKGVTYTNKKADVIDIDLDDY